MLPQPKVQKPQARRPKTLNLTDRYPSQTKAKQQWKAEMERLNSKYNLDFLIQSLTQSQMKENSTDMNMAMRHSYEFVKLFLWKHHFWNVTYWLFLWEINEPKPLI